MRQKTVVLPDTVKVTISVRWAIIVDDDVNTLNVNATAENVSGYKNTLFEGLEGSVTVNSINMKFQYQTKIRRDISNIPFFLSKTRVDANTREVA